MVSSVPVPFIWFLPFSSFPPSHTSFSSFFSCLPLLHVLSSHSFLSLARNGPGLSLYGHIHCTLGPLGSQVAQVLIMRFGSLFVPVHLVPSSSQPHTPLSGLVLFSCLHLFVLGYAHLCTHVLSLVFASPRGGVCVCVPLEITGILSDCDVAF